MPFNPSLGEGLSCKNRLQNKKVPTYSNLSNLEDLVQEKDEAMKNDAPRPDSNLARQGASALGDPVPRAQGVGSWRQFRGPLGLKVGTPKN